MDHATWKVYPAMYHGWSVQRCSCQSVSHLDPCCLAPDTFEIPYSQPWRPGSQIGRTRPKTSMAHCTMEACEHERLDRAGKIIDSPNDTKQKAGFATISQNGHLPNQLLRSQVFGPVSGHLTAQILPLMCHASRASHAGQPLVFSTTVCAV